MIFHYLIRDKFLMLSQKTGDRLKESLQTELNTIWLRLVFIFVLTSIICPESINQIIKVIIVTIVFIQIFDFKISSFFKYNCEKLYTYYAIFLLIINSNIICNQRQQFK